MKYWIPFLLLVSIVLTNRLIVDDPDMSIHGYDSKSYVQIAEAFPYLSTELMPHQHAQRLVGPWIVGALIKISPLSFYWTFEVVTFLLLFLMLHVVWVLCERLGAERSTCLLVTAVLAFNPYFSRFYFAIPTYVGDLLFLLGFALLLRALLFVEPALLIGALCIAAVGRQTALLLLPATCLWVVFHPDWKKVSHSLRLIHSAAAVVVVVGIYIVTDWLAYKINPVSINARHVFGLFQWIMQLWSGGPLELSQQEVPIVPTVITTNVGPVLAFSAYLLRGFLSLVIPMGMILAVTGWRGFLFGRSLSYLLLLFMSATILSQPILAGPSLTGHPVIRLGMFCIPALAVAFALLQVDSKTKISWSPKMLAAVIAVLFISSFHHRYTPWQGTVNQAPIFAALYFVCAVVIYGLLWKQKRSVRN